MSSIIGPIQAPKERAPAAQTAYDVAADAVTRIDEKSSANASALRPKEIKAEDDVDSETENFARSRFQFRTIPPIDVERALGNGAAGSVYLARYLDPWGEKKFESHRVAVKVLMADPTDDCGLLLDEAKRLAALDHPNILKVHDVGWIESDKLLPSSNYEVQESNPKFVMITQYVTGQSIEELGYCHYQEGSWDQTNLFSRSPEARRAFLKCFFDLLNGVEHLHTKKIVHRDLKPSNAVIDDISGDTILIDFGLAEDEYMLRMVSSKNLGTAPYMSPELINGEGIDHRSDIFALGVMLFEHYTGRHPFLRTPNCNAFVVMRCIDNNIPIAFDHLEQELCSSLRSVLLKGITHSPENRFQSCKEFAVSLKDALIEQELFENSRIVRWMDYAFPTPMPQHRASKTGNHPGSPG